MHGDEGLDQTSLIRRRYCLHLKGIVTNRDVNCTNGAMLNPRLQEVKYLTEYRHAHGDHQGPHSDCAPNLGAFRGSVLTGEVNTVYIQL